MYMPQQINNDSQIVEDANKFPNCVVFTIRFVVVVDMTI